jgi:hypothetical protein
MSVTRGGITTNNVVFRLDHSNSRLRTPTIRKSVDFLKIWGRRPQLGIWTRHRYYSGGSFWLILRESIISSQNDELCRCLIWTPYDHFGGVG